MDAAVNACLVGASYLVGGIPFGLLTVKLVKGIDIREVGSGNIGATNVGRVLGKVGFVAVFLLDFLKGFGPVTAAAWYARRSGCTSAGPSAWVIGCGLAAILGHVFPVYLKFRGGKAVATSTGVFTALAPWATLIGFVAFLAMFGLFRYVSLASMTAALAVVVGVFVTTEQPLGQGRALTVMTVIIAALIILRHKENIRRLLKGGENPFGKAKEPAAEAQAEDDREDAKPEGADEGQ